MKRLCSLFLCIWGAITTLFRNIFLLFFRKKSSATVRLKRVWKNSKKFSKKWKKEKKDMFFRVKDTVTENHFYTPIFAKIALFLPETQKKIHYFSSFHTYLKKLCFSVIYIVPGWGVHGGSASRVCKSSAERKNDPNSAGAVPGW